MKGTNSVTNSTFECLELLVGMMYLHYLLLAVRMIPRLWLNSAPWALAAEQ